MPACHATTRNATKHNVPFIWTGPAPSRHGQALLSSGEHSKDITHSTFLSLLSLHAYYLRGGELRSCSPTRYVPVPWGSSRLTLAKLLQGPNLYLMEGEARSRRRGR